VSVVITAYNTGRYLPETLESVFAQTYANYEVIVVDDGSTDDTRARARAYGSRILLLEREHEGLGPARNAGLARATGAYIAFLDSDDLWDPDALRTQVDVARRHPESGLVVCDGVEFEADTVTVPRLYPPWVASRVDAAPDGQITARMYREILSWCPANCPGQTLVPRHVVDTIGDVCITPHGVQDYDYYLRIARAFPVTLHAASLVRWRYRPESMSGPRSERGLRSAAQALRLYERELASCAPDDRAAVRAVIANGARHGLAEASRSRLEYGTIPDPADLATIYRFRPRDPVVIWARVAFALPAPLDRLVLRATRAARRAVRWSIMDA
jgi:glycosyltransferase involved in cell wall biosynthesis